MRLQDILMTIATYPKYQGEFMIHTNRQVLRDLVRKTF